MTKRQIAAYCAGTLALIIVILGGCGDKSGNLVIGDFAYPLHVGQVWRYVGMEYTSFFQPESLAATYTTNYGIVSAVEVKEQTVVGDTIPVYALKMTETITGQATSYSWDYFNNRPGGLYSFAYSHPSGSGGMEPRKLTRDECQYRFHGHVFASISELFRFIESPSQKQALGSDSITLETPPFLCVKYPFSSGSEWLTTSPPTVWPIGKKVLGRVDIQVPAGTFACAHILWRYDVDTNGVWDTNIEMHDYISQIGLVKREAIIRGIEVTGYENPTGIGTYDVSRVMELLSTHTPE
jgi:hypothetical protein